MRNYPEKFWRKLGYKMIKSSEVSDRDVKDVVDVLVTGSLHGIDSHGVRAIPSFTKKRPLSQMKIVAEKKATAVLDAGSAWGPVSAKMAMGIAIKKAKKQGIGACSITNSAWITNLFYYSLMAVKKDMIGIVIAREGPVCAPWGGTKPITGTNPMSIGIPADIQYPILLDFATTMVAEGHVLTNLMEGKPIPDGWLIDKDGDSVKGFDITLETHKDFWQKGGSLLPFGTYKGYGINVAIDAIAGALNRSGTGLRAKGQGVLMIALNIDAFIEAKDFKEEVDRLILDIKSSPVRPGFNEVLLPGEREFRTYEKRKQEGIPINEKSWENIIMTCNGLGIEMNDIKT